MTQALIVACLVGAAAYLLGLVGEPFGPNGTSSIDKALGARDSATRVSQVIDGDTVRLSDGRRVRLAQIDAPELRGRECYSRKSRVALIRIAPPGTAVRLETDPAVGFEDGFGRALGYVLAGSRNVNLELVRTGAASVWYFDGQRGRYARELLRAAREARASHAGLWAACSHARLDPSRELSTS